MRFTVPLLVVGVGLSLLGLARLESHADAQDKKDKQAVPRVEYKVVYSPVSHITVLEQRQVDGKKQLVEHGPKASAEAMTKQFNALAEEGWEYVGPLGTTGKQGADSGSGVLSLFKRSKQ
jgi:hypothetical protein